MVIYSWVGVGPFPFPCMHDLLIRARPRLSKCARRSAVLVAWSYRRRRAAMDGAEAPHDAARSNLKGAAPAGQMDEGGDDEGSQPSATSDVPHAHSHSGWSSAPPAGDTGAPHGHNADDDITEEVHWANVVASFSWYRHHALGVVQRMLRDLDRIPAHHRLLAGQWRGRVSAMRQAIDANNAFLQRMVPQGSQSVFQDGADGSVGSAVQSIRRPPQRDVNKAVSTLRQFAREWSELGKPEREKAFLPILQAVEERFPIDGAEDVNKYRILCPGSGLGRLPWEFASRGYDAQGNEFSFHMLIGSNFVLNSLADRNCVNLYPFVIDTCNVRSIRDQLTLVQIPDVDPSALPPAVAFSMAAGEFDEVYAEDVACWDVIATCFFLDTAHNPIAYMERMWTMLRPGGCWIHMGPLLYHYSELLSDLSLELSYEEVVAAAKGLGFVFEEASNHDMTYSANPFSMMQTVYRCAFHVARKPRQEGDDEEDEDEEGEGDEGHVVMMEAAGTPSNQDR